MYGESIMQQSASKTMTRFSMIFLDKTMDPEGSKAGGIA